MRFPEARKVSRIIRVRSNSSVASRPRPYNINLAKVQGCRNGFVEAIGNTPLILLDKISRETGCRIYGKAEFLNPGGSVKDRAALYLIEDAESRGLLKAGGIVVEGTAGNTGIGLAHVCRAKGYKCVIFMPNNQSTGKIALLRLLGAEVHLVPVVPFENTQNYNHQAKRFAAVTENAIWTNQFDNMANRLAHLETTGPEIWAQTSGGLDGFTCATGTGGTLAGITRYLKEASGGRTQCWLADPPGSILNSFIKSKGLLQERMGNSITEGIGQGRITDNLRPELSLLDGSFTIPDTETISMLYRLLDEEGLYVGASTALNVVAAYNLAKQLGPGKSIATILCDGAHRYSERLFSISWLREKNLEDAIPSHLRKYAVLP